MWEKAEEIGVSKNDYIRRLIDGDVTADKQDKILQEIIEVKEMIEKGLMQWKTGLYRKFYQKYQRVKTGMDVAMQWKYQLFKVYVW